MALTLSVLDQSPIPEGSSAGDALRNTVDLARHADRLGYHRYWLAEHHGTPGLACNSPEVMIGPVAAATQRIRVGTGGVMLPHYSPLKVAETFSMLAALYPGRVDLGIGRAPGTSAKVAHYLQRDRRQPLPDDFKEQLVELLGYFSSARYCSPNVALLGSSPQSAFWAAELGLPYVFADFINPRGAEFATIYRQHFHPSTNLAVPGVSVALWAICAETEEEALRLSASARMMLVNLFRGRQIQVPSVERAVEFLNKEAGSIEALPEGRRLILGDPSNIRRKIEAAASEYGAEEVLLVNILYDHAARVRSYELIAEAFSSSSDQRA